MMWTQKDPALILCIQELRSNRRRLRNTGDPPQALRRDRNLRRIMVKPDGSPSLFWITSDGR